MWLKGENLQTDYADLLIIGSTPLCWNDECSPRTNESGGLLPNGFAKVFDPLKKMYLKLLLIRPNMSHLYLN